MLAVVIEIVVDGVEVDPVLLLDALPNLATFVL